ETSQEPHDDEKAEHRAIDIDAGELCRPGIAADIVGLAEVSRPPDEKGEEQHDHGHEPEGRIDAEYLGLAEYVFAGSDVGDAVAGDELQSAAIDRERRKRGDQGVDLEPGDENAVDHPEQHAPTAADEECRERRKAELLDRKPCHDARKGKYAADREIEHPRDHQDHHAAGEDSGLRRVEQDNRGIFRPWKRGGFENRHRHDEGEDQNDEQQLPFSGDACQKIARARSAADRLLGIACRPAGEGCGVVHAAVSTRAFGAASSRMATSVAEAASSSPTTRPSDITTIRRASARTSGRSDETTSSAIHRAATMSRMR